jgi:hypothetical protein
MPSAVAAERSSPVCGSRDGPLDQERPDGMQERPDAETEDKLSPDGPSSVSPSEGRHNELPVEAFRPTRSQIGFAQIALLRILLIAWAVFTILASDRSPRGSGSA